MANSCHIGVFCAFVVAAQEAASIVIVMSAINHVGGKCVDYFSLDEGVRGILLRSSTPEPFKLDR
jgi:hypothetical protein